ncbi:hypothetical protein HOLDEFILI_00629 [Holdemania filiformis DSM 12042]|uniref:Uncharacterized protein n=1 Tax=Holdemania filiformis DSM 12042 TaxID=545696 RepID=B9Y498_9FIRM|nr:hypothetical protein HOLDEFILI_00629 [Holdemania filiformis DSM 12042]
MTLFAHCVDPRRTYLTLTNHTIPQTRDACKVSDHPTITIQNEKFASGKELLAGRTHA